MTWRRAARSAAEHSTVDAFARPRLVLVLQLELELVLAFELEFEFVLAKAGHGATSRKETMAPR